MPDTALIPPHGGYRKLKSFRLAQLVYDLTLRFCDRYVNSRSRTHDQMVQAARSGVQNIAEASEVSATSRKMEIKLTQVARASQPRFGRPALGLDLMEEFRPLIAESTVLNCINNRVITEKDFVKAGQAVNLAPPGRKRFFQTYEQRMSSVLTHPLFDYKVSYRRALELPARLLAKALTGEIPEYIPLMTR
jgi:hypothetical protein